MLNILRFSIIIMLGLLLPVFSFGKQQADKIKNPKVESISPYEISKIKGYTLESDINDKGEVILKREGYLHKHSQSGTELLKEFPKEGMDDDRSISKFTNSGIIFGKFDLHIPFDEKEFESELRWHYQSEGSFVYYPEHGYIDLYNEIKKSYPNLIVFEALDMSEVGTVIGLAAHLSDGKIANFYWTFDIKKGFNIINLNPLYVDYISLNKNDKVLFADYNREDFIIYFDNDYNYTQNFGLQKFIEPYSSTHIQFDDIKSLVILDDDSITGVIEGPISFEAGTSIDGFYDDGSLVFIFNPNRSLYVSGFSEFINEGKKKFKNSNFGKDVDDVTFFNAKKIIANQKYDNFAYLNKFANWPLVLSNPKINTIIMGYPKELQVGIQNIKVLDFRFIENGSVQILGIYEKNDRENLFIWTESMGVDFLDNLKGYRETIKINTKGDIVLTNDSDNEKESVVYLYYKNKF